jgi:hypothetical protein
MHPKYFGILCVFIIKKIIQQYREQSAFHVCNGSIKHAITFQKEDASQTTLTVNEAEINQANDSFLIYPDKIFTSY